MTDKNGKEFQDALIATMVSHGIDEKQATGISKGVIRKITPKHVDNYLKEAITSRYNKLEQSGVIDSMLRKHVADQLGAAMKSTNMRTMVADEAQKVARTLYDFLFKEK